MMVRHIRLDRRQFYLFEGLGINSQYENKPYQYQWAIRHPVVKEAITRALNNR